MVVKNQEKYTLPISDVWFSSYGRKGQRSKTFVNFGHMGSNIKNCWICKIFLNFSFEILKFVSSKAKYRYVFEFIVLLCHTSHTVVSRESHFLQATAPNTDN